MRGQLAGKTMYVIPYLMAPPGSPLEQYAAGVELTDNRPVVLHMIRMARVGVDLINKLADPDTFVRAVHVTGDLENLGQGTPDDQRYFVTVADERTILHFGSSYGGNALLGKIAHGLRQACYDGRASGEFLAEQFMLLGITDKETGKKWHVCGGFPSASGKTNLAMTLAPDALGDRYHVEFYGDDIAWLWVGDDGRVYGMNPEFGVFGVAKDTNERTNPTALESIAEGTGASSPTSPTTPTPTRSGGRAGRPSRRRTSPAGRTGRASRSPTGPRATTRRGPTPTAGSPPRWPTCPTSPTTSRTPPASRSTRIIFGGRTSDREPLVRAITDLAEGVYDGLTLGAEATFAADGLDGQLRYDPMSMRPFMAYGEGDYAAHWLKIIGAATEQPIFAHVNWFQKDPDDGHFLWPGYRENLRALLWLCGSRTARSPAGRRRSASSRPRRSSTSPASTSRRRTSTGCSPSTHERWRQEMGFREEHLEQFDRLPEAIWEAHRRVAAALDAAELMPLQFPRRAGETLHFQGVATAESA